MTLLGHFLKISVYELHDLAFLYRHGAENAKSIVVLCARNLLACLALWQQNARLRIEDHIEMSGERFFYGMLTAG